MSRCSCIHSDALIPLNMPFVFTQMIDDLHNKDPLAALNPFKSVKNFIDPLAVKTFTEKLIKLIKMKDEVRPSSHRWKEFNELLKELENKVLNAALLSLQSVALKTTEIDRTSEYQISEKKIELSLDEINLLENFFVNLALKKIQFVGYSPIRLISCLLSESVAPGDGRIKFDFYKKNNEALFAFLSTNSTEKLLEVIKNIDSCPESLEKAIEALLHIKNKQILRRPCIYMLPSLKKVQVFQLSRNFYANVHKSIQNLRQFTSSSSPLVEFSSYFYNIYRSPCYDAFFKNEELSLNFKLKMNNYYGSICQDLGDNFLEIARNIKDYDCYFAQFAATWENPAIKNDLDLLMNKILHKGSLTEKEIAYLNSDAIEIFFEKQNEFLSYLKKMCKKISDGIGKIKSMSLFLALGNLTELESKISGFYSTKNASKTISEHCAIFLKREMKAPLMIEKYGKLDKEYLSIIKILEKAREMVDCLNQMAFVHTTLWGSTFQELREFGNLECLYDTSSVCYSVSVEPTFLLNLSQYKTIKFNKYVYSPPSVDSYPGILTYVEEHGLSDAYRRAKIQNKTLVASKATLEHKNILRYILQSAKGALDIAEVNLTLERIAKLEAENVSLSLKHKKKEETKEEKRDSSVALPKVKSTLLAPIAKTDSDDTLSSSSSSSSFSPLPSTSLIRLEKPLDIEKSLEAIHTSFQPALELLRKRFVEFGAGVALTNARIHLQDFIFLQENLLEKVVHLSTKEQIFSTVTNLVMHGSLALEQLLQAINLHFNPAFNKREVLAGLTHDLNHLFSEIPPSIRTACFPFSRTIRGTNKGEIYSRDIAYFAAEEFEDCYSAKGLLTMAFDSIHEADSCYELSDVIQEATKYCENIMKTFLKLCVSVAGEQHFPNSQDNLQELTHAFSSEISRVSAEERVMRLPQLSWEQTSAVAVIEAIGKAVGSLQTKEIGLHEELDNVQRNLLCRLTSEVAYQSQLNPHHLRAHYFSIFLLNQTIADELLNFYLIKMGKRVSLDRSSHHLLEKLTQAQIPLESFSAEVQLFLLRSKNIKNTLRYVAENERSQSSSDPCVQIKNAMDSAAVLIKAPKTSFSKVSKEAVFESEAKVEAEKKEIEEGFVTVVRPLSGYEKRLNKLKTEPLEDIRLLGSFVETIISLIEKNF